MNGWRLTFMTKQKEFIKEDHKTSLILKQN